MVDQSLQLRLTQKLALAPQLQQAIRLLQLNRIELREYLQQTIEANPLLEREEPGLGDDPGADRGIEEASDASGSEDDWSDESDFGAEASRDSDEDWSSLDEQWGEQWGDVGAHIVDREQEIADRSGGSLREHLMFQVGLSHFSERDEAIATAIIYALDEDGYLLDTPEEIRDSLAPEYLIEDDELRAVLHRIQRMEPVGSATRDPAECIRVQLSVLPASTPGLELARRIARDYIDLVAERDQDRLLGETGASEETLKQALDLIRSLEPRPGARYDNREDEYLVPDVYLRRVDGRWVTRLSPDNDPRLRLNRYYVQLLRQSGAENRKYLEGRLQEARWLMSSLELRNRTLLTVSQSIVDEQQEFLEHGEIAMRPLILKDIAELAGVHESTVSRATNRKYMLTPRGLFELKYFFSSHVRRADGGTVSATAVKARLQALLEAEPPDRPLSDQELSRRLREEDIVVARRTVAKYRESLGIGSSSERRKAYRRLGFSRT
jgi:RNA polymerase sigma-54 factor